MDYLDWIGWAAVAAFVWRVWPLWFGMLRRRALAHLPPLPPDDPEAPMVSIIVPARDEAGAVEHALLSLLALDYPNYEVVAINDRSRDGTGEIMERVAGADPRCRVIHIRELPAGWLGKNHANMLGARHAQGDYLLFTDGDVVLRKSVLRHAMRFMQDRDLDHLTLLPETPSTGFWQSLLMNHFVVLFGMMTRYPLTRFRRFRGAYIGIGAFNLVRRAAYETIGTHERLRMEVADDLMLGRLIKQHGLTQDALDGRPLVWVRWQTGMRGIISGLEKNVFAGARYSLAIAALGVFAQVFLAVVPPVLAVTGPAQLPALVLCALMLFTFGWTALASRANPLLAVFYPLAHLIFAYVVARSTFVTLRDGGVTWRGTFYPLAELRRGMV